MDMSDFGWSQQIREQEAAYYGACFEAAEKTGLSIEQAEECDEGSLGCPDCPWKKELLNYKRKEQ